MIYVLENIGKRTIVCQDGSLHPGGRLSVCVETLTLLKELFPLEVIVIENKSVTEKVNAETIKEVSVDEVSPLIEESPTLTQEKPKRNRSKK